MISRVLTWISIHNNSFTPWPFRPKGYCRCPCLSVRPSARPSARKLYLVRTVTRHKFELESSNLHQTCIMGYPRLVLKTAVIDPDLLGQFHGNCDSEFYAIWLVRAITHHRFVLALPNCTQRASWDTISWYWKWRSLTWTFNVILAIMGAIDRDLQGHLAISTDKTAFHIALVHWSKPANGCYTSQTCSCLSYVTAYSCTDSNVDTSDAILMLCSQFFAILWLCFFPV